MPIRRLGFSPDLTTPSETRAWMRLACCSEKQAQPDTAAREAAKTARRANVRAIGVMGLEYLPCPNSRVNANLSNHCRSLDLNHLEAQLLRQPLQALLRAGSWSSGLTGREDLRDRFFRVPCSQLCVSMPTQSREAWHPAEECELLESSTLQITRRVYPPLRFIWRWASRSLGATLRKKISAYCVRGSFTFPPEFRPIGRSPCSCRPPCRIGGRRRGLPSTGRPASSSSRSVGRPRAAPL